MSSRLGSCSWALFGRFRLPPAAHPRDPADARVSGFCSVSGRGCVATSVYHRSTIPRGPVDELANQAAVPGATSMLPVSELVQRSRSAARHLVSGVATLDSAGPVEAVASAGSVESGCWMSTFRPCLRPFGPPGRSQLSAVWSDLFCEDRPRSRACRSRTEVPASFSLSTRAPARSTCSPPTTADCPVISISAPRHEQNAHDLGLVALSAVRPLVTDLLCPGCGGLRGPGGHRQKDHLDPDGRPGQGARPLFPCGAPPSNAADLRPAPSRARVRRSCGKLGQ